MTVLMYGLCKIDETHLYHSSNQAAHLFTAGVLKKVKWLKELNTWSKSATLRSRLLAALAMCRELFLHYGSVQWLIPSKLRNQLRV